MEKVEKAGPPKSRSASPKGRGDKVCRDFQKGNCKRGDKCPYSHKAEKPAAPAIKVVVTSTVSATTKKSISFSNAIQTKQYRVPVKEKRTAEDPYQRHSKPRLCDAGSFASTEHLESVKAHAETARSAGELLHEVASKRRFKPEKAWLGQDRG